MKAIMHFLKLAVIFLIFSFVSVSAIGQEKLSSEPIITIPKDRIEIRVKDAELQGRKDSPELRKTILDELINLEVISQAALKNGLNKNPEIAQQIEIVRQSVLAAAFVQEYSAKYLQGRSKDEQKNELSKVISKLRKDFPGGEEGVSIPQLRVDIRAKAAVQHGQKDTLELRGAIRSDLINLEVLSQTAVSKGLDKLPETAQKLEFVSQSALAAAFVQDYMKSHPISREVLKQKYESMKTHVGNTEYRISHILVETEEEANKVEIEVQNGRFDEVAKAMSNDPGSKDKGGDLGWIVPTKFVQLFGDALLKLNKGQISAPVHSQFGWHVIKLVDIRAIKVPSFDEMIPNLERLMQQESLRNVIEDLRSKFAVANAETNGGATTLNTAIAKVPADDDLVAAAAKGDLPRIKALLEANIDVNLKVLSGATALTAATQAGHLDVVQALLAKGADINVKENHGATALMIASELGRKDIVQLLLDKGADVNVKKKDGATALLIASQNGHKDVVLLLRQHDRVVTQAEPERIALSDDSSIRRFEAVGALNDAGALLRIASRMPTGDAEELEVFAAVRAEQNGVPLDTLCRAILGGKLFSKSGGTHILGCSWAAVQGRPGFEIAGTYLGFLVDRATHDLNKNTFIEYADGFKDDRWIISPDLKVESIQARFTGTGGTEISILGIMAGWTKDWLGYKGTCSNARCYDLLTTGAFISSSTGGNVISSIGTRDIDAHESFTNVNLLNPSAPYGSLDQSLGGFECGNFVLLFHFHPSQVRRVSIAGSVFRIVLDAQSSTAKPSASKKKSQSSARR